MRIETLGRKTRRPHQVVVRFVSIANKIVIFPMRGVALEQDWVLNVLANPNVKIFVDENIWFAKATLKKISGLNDPLLSIFSRKYGRQVVANWYFGQHSYIELELVTGSHENIDRNQIIYGDLEAAFDGVAEHYDAHIFGNAMNSWLRNVSVTLMCKVFKKKDTIIEIGCGTGTETLALARSGHTIVACDISQKMLDVLSRKVSEQGLQERVILVRIKSSKQLTESILSRVNGSFGGAYSTYGAINTEPDLKSLFESLGSLLMKGSPLVLGVWNKYCVYEMLGYSLRLKPSLAFARLRNPVPVGKSRFCLSSNAFSVNSLKSYISPTFRLESVYGVLVTLPPSNLVRYAPEGKMLGIAKQLDLKLGRIFPFNRLGDHFLGVYRKL